MRRWGAPVAVAGSLAVAAAAFLPAARSGAAARTSFEVVRAAEQLEVVSGPGAVVARGWYLVPLVAAVAWIAATQRARPVVIAAALSLSVASSTLAILIIRAPLTMGPGTPIVLLAGAVALVGAVRLSRER